MTKEQAYNNAINKGVTIHQIRLTKTGINVYNGAFEYKKWTDKTLPNYIRDLFPFILNIGNSAFKSCKFTKLNMEKVIFIDDNAFEKSKIEIFNMTSLKILGENVFNHIHLKKFNAPKLEKSPITGRVI